MTNSRNFLISICGLTIVIFLINGCTPSTKKPILSKGIVVTTWDADMSVNKVAFEKIKTKSSATDAVEAGAISIENTINCCVGLGGNPDRDGYVTLDACIMDHLYNCGSVAYVKSIQNPISLARLVMEKSPHVMFVGDGAEKFASENNIKLVKNELSNDAKKEYKKWLEKSEYKPQINIEKNQNSASPMRLSDGKFNHDTMGLLAIDDQNHIAGACTTSGMGFKMAGRIGDSPIIGSGLYVDNEVGGAVASGQGEEVIRVCGTHLVVEFMRQGMSPELACKTAIERIIRINPTKAKDFQVGFIAINKEGQHGAYAIHPGFTYAVSDVNGLQAVNKSKSIMNL